MEANKQIEPIQVTGWDKDKTKVASILVEKFEVKPRSKDLIDHLKAAEIIYKNIYEEVSPALNTLGDRMFFDRLSSEASKIAFFMTPKRGERTDKSFVELTEIASHEISDEIAEAYERKLSQERHGVQDLSGRWFETKSLRPNISNMISSLESSIFKVNTSKKGEGWIIGIINLQDELHKNLDRINKALREGEGTKARSTGGEEEIDLEPVMTAKLEEELNESFMVAIDKLELAFLHIAPEFRREFVAVQESFTEYLQSQGIERRIPKIGDPFDPKWQTSTFRSGQGEKVTRVDRGAFIKNGHVIQGHDALVEVG